MRDHSPSLRLYKWLLRLYPAGFRENYAEEMEREIREELAESSGAWALARLWLRLFGDLAVSIPAQISREASQDARHTLRLWEARPWHTGFAIAAVAIGIGANTGVFSVVNALLLRSLPFQEADRLAAFDPHEFIPPHDSAKQFDDWRAQCDYLADAALVEENDANIGGLLEAERAHVAQTSPGFFATLGAQPVLGRAFHELENDTAVIGDGLWQRLFAGEKRVLGATIRIDGKLLTIIGVAPAGFDYPNGTVVWKPAQFSPGNNGWATVVRLKPGVSWPMAQAAFDRELVRLAPDAGNPRAKIRPLRQALAGPAANGSLMLMAGVVLVLLIACTNVANLLMARTVDRAMELSIRSALGASRARLIQQLLTECLLLSFVATLAGLILANWIVSIAAVVQPPPLGAQRYSVLDGRVLGFTVILSIFSGLLFGVLPALYGTRLQRAGRRRWIREGLAASQVMLTIILLTASVSVGRAFMRLMGNDRGYKVDSVVTVNLSLEGTTRRKSGVAYFEEVLARVRVLPGVQNASATEFLPLYATGFVGGPFGLDGRRAARNSTMIPVFSDYFETMGARILQGRDFTDEEVRSGAKVAVVNERFAAGFGSPEDVLGRLLTAGRSSQWKIVGVAKGMNYETDPTLVNSNQVFIPAESPGGFFSTIVARVRGRPEDQLAMVRDTVRSVDPEIPVFGVKTMEQRLNDLFARPKFYRTAVWMFAGFAVLLAVIGIYGIVSYAVAERTREMGVRLALGTTPGQLRSVLLRQGLVLVLAGAIPGLAGAKVSERFLQNLIEGATPVDVLTSAGLIVFLASVASASIWMATRRIAGLDVMAVLRLD